jgi:hypothetical protein
MKAAGFLILLLFLTSSNIGSNDEEKTEARHTELQRWRTGMESTVGAEKSDVSRLKQPCCPIVELRQYTLHPGKRDVLIDLFDQEFVESQEALGISVIGQFRDLGNANRFVWLRGFPDMTLRAEALKAFYSGPTWKANREAANATMVDTDNVLLLRPARPESAFSFKNTERLPAGSNVVLDSRVVATIYFFDAPVGPDFVDFFERVLKPVLVNAGASILGYFVTESSANTFPALPVREGEYVFVWFSRFQDQAAYEHYLATLAASRQWRDEISNALASRLKGSSEVLILSPTSRSLLGY